MGNIDEALAWAVQAHDREFRGAEFVKILIEERQVLEDNGEWLNVWDAEIQGDKPEPEPQAASSEAVGKSD